VGFPLLENAAPLAVVVVGGAILAVVAGVARFYWPLPINWRRTFVLALGIAFSTFYGLLVVISTWAEGICDNQPGAAYNLVGAAFLAGYLPPTLVAILSKRRMRWLWPLAPIVGIALVMAAQSVAFNGSDGCGELRWR
jgi:hypothetical protein